MQLEELKTALKQAIDSLEVENLEGQDNVIVYENDEYRLSLTYK